MFEIIARKKNNKNNAYDYFSVEKKEEKRIEKKDSMYTRLNDWEECMPWLITEKSELEWNVENTMSSQTEFLIV